MEIVCVYDRERERERECTEIVSQGLASKPAGSLPHSVAKF